MARPRSSAPSTSTAPTRPCGCPRTPGCGGWSPARTQPEQVTGSLATEDGTGEISEQLVVRFRGPNRLIGSGHPPPGSELPSALGLIESEDAGKTWSSISELGAGDFHSLQASGDVIIGGLFGEAAVSVSTDGGKRFSTRTAPSQLVDLAVDPGQRRSPGSPRTAAGSSPPPTEAAHGARAGPCRTSASRGRAATRCTGSTPAGRSSSAPTAARRGATSGTSGGEPQALFSDRPWPPLRRADRRHRQGIQGRRRDLDRHRHAAKRLIYSSP